MPNTTGGLPYPANTDPASQAPAAIQALAVAVDTALSHGALPNPTDLNALKRGVAYGLGGQLTNAPNANSGFVVTFDATPTVRLQLWADNNGAQVYIRTYWAGTWYPWRKVTVT